MSSPTHHAFPFGTCAPSKPGTLLPCSLLAFSQALRELERTKSYAQALDYSEQVAAVMSRDNESPSAIVQHVAETMHRANQYSADLLSSGDPLGSVALLTQAERLLLKYDSSSALSDAGWLLYNNLACGYKRLGKPQDAIKCLDHCLSEYARRGSPRNLPMTYLNRSAVLSQAGRHDTALASAATAVSRCQDIILSLEIRMKADGAADKLVMEKEREEVVSMLAIACYNVGIQNEFLGKHRVAFQEYCKARELVRDFGTAESAALRNKFDLAVFQCRSAVDGLASRKAARPCSSRRREPRVPLPKSLRMTFRRKSPPRSAATSPNNSGSRTAASSPRRNVVVDAAKLRRARTARKHQQSVGPDPGLGQSYCSSRHGRETTRGETEEDLKTELRTEPREKLQCVPIGFLTRRSSLDSSRGRHRCWWNKARTADLPPAEETKIDPDRAEIVSLRRNGFLDWSDEEEDTSGAKPLRIKIRSPPIKISAPARLAKSYSIKICHHRKAAADKIDIPPSASIEQQNAPQSPPTACQCAFGAMDTRTVSECNDKAAELFRTTSPELEVHAAIMIQRWFRTVAANTRNAAGERLVLRAFLLQHPGRRAIVTIRCNARTGQLTVRAADFASKIMLLTLTHVVGNDQVRLIREVWQRSAATKSGNIEEICTAFFTEMDSGTSEAVPSFGQENDTEIRILAPVAEEAVPQCEQRLCTTESLAPDGNLEQAAMLFSPEPTVAPEEEKTRKPRNQDLARRGEDADRKVRRIQRSVRKWLGYIHAELQRAGDQREWETVILKGMQLGGAYQLIKALISKTDRDRIVLISSRARNQIRFRLSKLLTTDMWEEMKIDMNDIKRLFKFHMQTFLDYNAASRSLVLVPAATTG